MRHHQAPCWLSRSRQRGVNSPLCTPHKRLMHLRRGGRWLGPSYRLGRSRWLGRSHRLGGYGFLFWRDNSFLDNRRSGNRGRFSGLYGRRSCDNRRNRNLSHCDYGSGHDRFRSFNFRSFSLRSCNDRSCGRRSNRLDWRRNNCCQFVDVRVYFANDGSRWPVNRRCHSGRHNDYCRMVRGDSTCRSLGNHRADRWMGGNSGHYGMNGDNRRCGAGLRNNLAWFRASRYMAAMLRLFLFLGQNSLHHVARLGDV